jgi:transketolase
MNELDTIRTYILLMLADKGSGHLGGALGSLESVYAMVGHIDYTHNWDSFMRLPKDEQLAKAIEFRKQRDIFILSNGHVCAGLYAIWVFRGLFDQYIETIWDEYHLDTKLAEIQTKWSAKLDATWLKTHEKRITFLATFRELYSCLDGHPSLHHLPFLVDTSTGPLAQGAGVSVGYAWNQKQSHHPYYTYVSLGDGECQEGQIWEAAMIAAQKKLDNLVWVVDRNFIQIDGNTEEIAGLDNGGVFNKHSGLADKFVAFGWEVYENVHGNDYKDVKHALEILQSTMNKTGKPGVLINYTRVGYPYQEFYSYKWHGKTPTSEEVMKALHERA